MNGICELYQVDEMDEDDVNAEINVALNSRYG